MECLIGFTLICNKCKRAIILDMGHPQYDVITSGHGGEVYITCDVCGNEVFWG